MENFSFASHTILIPFIYSLCVWCVSCLYTFFLILSPSSHEFNHSILKIIHSIEYCILERRQCYTCTAINYTHIKLLTGIGSDGGTATSTNSIIKDNRISMKAEGALGIHHHVLCPDYAIPSFSQFDMNMRMCVLFIKIIRS